MQTSELKENVRDAFDPIARTYGLSGPIETSLATTEFHLGYSNERLGFEITVDLSDFFIYVLIFKPVGNQAPIGYEDESGKRRKLYLQQALKELAIDASKETRALQKLGGDYRNCDKMLAILAPLLWQYWPQISADPDRWFP